MSNEQLELLGDAYKNFENKLDEIWQRSDVGDLDDMIYDGLLVDGTDENGEWLARIPSKEEFINKIKIDDVFANQFNCKIEERELSSQERKDLYDKTNYTKDIFPTDESGWNKLFDGYSIPTRAISVTYNNETIESYEHN
jgi:hypothetical protein